jgi:putative ABC transport system permease protein
LAERLLRDPDPTWTKAPTALLGTPSVLAAVAAAALALALAGSAAPLFESSAGSAALSREIATASRWEAGFSVVAYGPLSGPSGNTSMSAEELFRRRDAFLRHRLRGDPGLGPPVITVLGSTATVFGPTGRGTTVQLLSRTGFRGHVQRRSGSGPGLWVAASAALRVRAGAGDPVLLRIGNHSATARVAGVYADLSAAPLSDYWTPAHDVIVGGPSGTPPPPPLLIDLETFRRLGRPLPQVARFTWQFPLATTRPSLSEAQGTARRTSGVAQEVEAGDDPSVQTLFQQSTAQTALPALIARAGAVMSTVRGPAEAIGLAGRVVALLVVVAAGLYATERRRAEVGLLSVRGVTPGAQGGRAMLQAIGPVAVGSVSGWLAGSWLVSELGPGGAIDAGARVSASVQIIAGGVVALLLIAAVGAVSSREGAGSTASSIRQAVARAPWEIALLVLAAGSYYELLVHGPSSDASGAGQGLDVFLLLFPILFIVGGAGLVARVLGRLLPRLRAGGGSSPALFLAARRLAAASAPAMLLLAGTAAGLGVLVYAGVATSSTAATNIAKAGLLTGGDVRVTLAPNTDLRTLPPTATQVARIGGASLLPSDQRVDVVAVDPPTFLHGVHWRASFAPVPPQALLDHLGPWNGRVPVVIARGQVPAGGILSMSGVTLPVRSVGRAAAFPGMAPGRPLVVISEPELERYLVDHETTLGAIAGEHEVWARGDAGPLLQRLRRSGVDVREVRTAAAIRNSTTFLALSWTLGLLGALGILAALVALAAMVIYLHTLQQSRGIPYALASRMGLSRMSHRRSVALELAGMLLVAFMVGVGLAIGGALLVLSRLDLVPQIPPAPFLSIPVGPILLLVGALVIVAVAGAWWVHRGAEHVRVAEVVRLAS